MSQPSRIAERMDAIAPFHVMDLLARARRMERDGRSIVHMEIGEPDFPTPGPIIAAGRQALAEGRTHYTPALGLPALREAIASYYATRYGVEIDPDRVVVTPGASGALHLLLAVLVDPGRKVLLSDPGYPCNRHLVRLVDGVPVSIPVEAEGGYQLGPAHIAAYWDAQTVAAMVASPSNPTGTILGQAELSDLAKAVFARDGHLIVDEIYHGLVYGPHPPTALSVSDDIFVINSFSKYFGMTGWRLGWLIAPQAYIPALDRLAQNLFLAAPTPAQYAALSAFGNETMAIMEARRAEFQQRRDYLLPALRKIGFAIDAEPAGAFYLYAKASRFTDDSFTLANRLLDEVGVAVTPGIDFGTHRAHEYLRFAYTTTMPKLEEGVARLAAFLK
ncbi:MAG: pyridoxal phosphate-dependent aminotransferase [Gammaproteobacteria bacterium]|nr:pyridoxal phosphate-dependent aminotransferase [Gammaproteobacteria bacterium]MCP5135607.1 pyridoxal phosphate-dependent aminotransferase [Gammaproteobacteria bacterium]